MNKKWNGEGGNKDQTSREQKNGRNPNTTGKLKAKELKKFLIFVYVTIQIFFFYYFFVFNKFRNFFVFVFLLLFESLVGFPRKSRNLFPLSIFPFPQLGTFSLRLWLCFLQLISNLIDKEFAPCVFGFRLPFSGISMFVSSFVWLLSD